MPLASYAILARNEVYESFYLTGVPADVSVSNVTLTEFLSCLALTKH